MVAGIGGSYGRRGEAPLTTAERLLDLHDHGANALQDVGEALIADCQ